jgi:hypothetical protein
MRVSDLHLCKIGDIDYWFRTPTEYDTPLLRHALTRRGVRRPMQAEIRVAAAAGVKALGDIAGDVAEAQRQDALLDDWYRLLKPIIEDEIDEPDFERRAVELARLQQEQSDERRAIAAEVSAIEAMLARHWPPYAELLADRDLFDDLSQIEIVRQLLVRRAEKRVESGEGGQAVERTIEVDLPRDRDERLTSAAYQAIPKPHRPVLTAFAMRLLVPGEVLEKN